MRVGGLIICGFAAASLAGCSTILENGATAELEEQCAARGMQFVKTESRKTEAIVLSSASVTGECVGPTDPRYIAAEPAETA